MCLSPVFVWLFPCGFSAVVQFPLVAKHFFGAGRWYPLLASARHSIGNCGVLLVVIRLYVLLPLELLLSPEDFHAAVCRGCFRASTSSQGSVSVTGESQSRRHAPL